MGERTRTERVIDEVLPEELDWEHLVRSYPLPALAVAALAGFWIGSRHGSEVLGAASAFASDRARESVQQVFGELGVESRDPD